MHKMRILVEHVTYCKANVHSSEKEKCSAMNSEFSWI